MPKETPHTPKKRSEQRKPPNIKRSHAAFKRRHQKKLSGKVEPINFAERLAKLANENTLNTDGCNIDLSKFIIPKQKHPFSVRSISASLLFFLPKPDPAVFSARPTNQVGTHGKAEQSSYDEEEASSSASRERKEVEGLAEDLDQIYKLDVDAAKAQSIRELPTIDFAHRNLVESINDESLDRGTAESMEIDEETPPSSPRP